MDVDISELDKYFKPAGPCMLCGHPDKRHRLWDTIIALTDSDEVVAHLYDLPIEAVKLVRELRPYQ